MSFPMSSLTLLFTTYLGCLLTVNISFSLILVCKYKAHKRCAIRAPNNCKWSTLASVGTNIIEDGEGNLGKYPISENLKLEQSTTGSVY